MLSNSLRGRIQEEIFNLPVCNWLFRSWIKGIKITQEYINKQIFFYHNYISLERDNNFICTQFSCDWYWYYLGACTFTHFVLFGLQYDNSQSYKLTLFSQEPRSSKVLKRRPRISESRKQDLPKHNHVIEGYVATRKRISWSAVIGHTNTSIVNTRFQDTFISVIHGDNKVNIWESKFDDFLDCKWKCCRPIHILKPFKFMII